MTTDSLEIIAHRGSSFLAPENTLAAANLAWQEGADAVEGDFRLSADGHIVCIHDADLRRTAGIDRRVAQCTLAELKACDIGSWKGPQFADERVPTLDEMLATLPAGKRLYLEVKCGPEIIEPLKAAIAQQQVRSEQIVIISLNEQVVRHAKQSIPQCLAYCVVEFKKKSGGDWLPTVDEVLRRAEAAMADGLDLMATGPIDAALIDRAKLAGLKLCVWTIDDPALAGRLIDIGISSITTNRPGWLRKQLQS